MTIPRVLIIAGSDSSGGAGIQADLKATAVLGAYTMTVVTALTAQNTLGVTGIHHIPLDFVRTQFTTVVEDIGLNAVKTGMLYSAELIDLVSNLLTKVTVPIVVDPVMSTKGGNRLLKKDAITALRTKLLPHANLITPNLDEAEIILDQPIRNVKAMTKASIELVKMGAQTALIKGGHLINNPADVLFDGYKVYIFRAPRINTLHTHGTGCTLASACAALLAQGWKIVPAVVRARLLVRQAIYAGLAIGRGRGPVNALADLTSRLKLKSLPNNYKKTIIKS